ncbi:hypothetical protein IB286_13875 [Spongiibacter sp. KMU-158]|uniref:Uncharacterized protein n=1 Tax=Spongiibacter pelagi TaxID=2760804 RepID=A0A927GY53_9GAMM|nr:hypothetical protein [Spongiibacter pelagi]MBD2860089.1 hypothetical protein [Spongiibacter pelagi]
MPDGVWQVILAAVLSNAVALGVLGFLFKALIGHFLDKDVAQYKSKLEAANLRLQIAYGGIFERQANAILELYSKVLELEHGAGSSEIKDPQGWNDYKESIQKAAAFYHEQRVLLPYDLDKAVLDTIQNAHEVLASSTCGEVPSDVINNFRAAKDATLYAMRKLLSVGVSSNEK